MVRYAESIQCRPQLIREYFGEPPGAPCGRCDACVDPVEVPAVAAASVDDREPSSAASPGHTFEAGEIVLHRRFGKGQVVDVADADVEVSFDRYGKRRVLASYLSSQAGSQG